MATKLHVVTGDQYRIIDRRMREIKRQLDQENGSPLDPDAVAQILQQAVEGCFGGQSKFLKLISGGECLIIDPVDGSELLVNVDGMFVCINIYSDFQNWGADEPGPSTGQTSVCVYEMVKDATFAQMFGSLAPDVSKLCFTQHQIRDFVRKHRQLLRKDGYHTFFLFKSHDHFLVACVFDDSFGRLEADVHQFGLSDVWCAGGRRLVVVP